MAQLRSYRSTGLIGQSSGAAVAALKARAAAWDVPLTENAEQLAMSVWGCELRLTPHGDSLSVDLAAPEERLIGTLRDSATEIFAEVGLQVAWDHVDAGALAPGLSLMRVASVHDLTPGFIRVRLTGEDTARFTEGGMHFRLLLPPAGRTAIWPRVQPTGRVGWPEGADALHRAVYTVAAYGPGWLDFDIFRHAGSPTCDWAADRALGMTVGIMGPGGGTCPTAPRVHLFGDETALPAMRRILAEAPGAVTATIRASVADLGDLAQDARVHSADDLVWAVADTDIAPEDHVWFAASADESKFARKALIARGHAKRDMMIAAYWS
ncbi:siderophore-interacting protein [Paracoccus sp. 1_MG-2023]|uniref:siderophore-interacting protein n=1 Tax=unclassified Paracoccus (in: a-proteobacteria) TaxID=2688777 RepID=UPI001C09EF87|nr:MULTISPECIES: siderophore-interacting protein [unclassified Paracoccus (in: a-proteobacteria)]MBU2958869.1 siderophore-interacting protein [Paracoccus sp. C2R09]MDO6669999.1 siderophore-interacting protein [Paracoccus sp. 1_MG-2023]